LLSAVGYPVETALYKSSLLLLLLLKLSDYEHSDKERKLASFIATENINKSGLTKTFTKSTPVFLQIL